MKKLLLLLCTMLMGASFTKAAVTVTWESYPGWTRNDVASVWWVGITTPGTTSDTYKMSDFQFAQETGYGANTCYTAIAKTGPTASGAVLAESDVLAVSTNAVSATAQEYYTYNLASEIELTGATTYYMVFLSDNTPTDGFYTVTSQRVSLNTSYGTYAAGTMSSGGARKDTWTPGFKATLTTDAVYTVTYTCYSLADGSTIGSGTYNDVVGAVTAPAVDGYVFKYATTTDGTTFNLTQDITENTELKFYYNPLVNVTYQLYDSDGTTLLDTETIEQESNSEISIPASLSSYTYYDYTAVGTIGDEDCTIKVIRTLKEGVVIALNGLSNDKCYNIRNNRGTWAVGNGATDINSTVELNLAFLSTDPKQQFAFITYEGNVYLYSVSEKKFAYVDGTKLSLTSAVTSNVEASPVTFTTSTSSYTTSAPIIVTVGGGMFGVSTGKSPDVFKYNYANDDGNAALIQEAGDFDPTDALAALETYFHPTNCFDRVEAEILPYLMDGEGNMSATIGKPFGITNDAATEIVSTYLSQLNAQQFTLEEYEAAKAILEANIVYPENGKFYIIKSVSNGKYLNVKAANGIYADLDAPAAGAVVQAQIRDGKTYFATQGKEFGWCYTASYPALLDNAGGGKYAHFVLGKPGEVAFAHALGNGEDGYATYLPQSYYTVSESNQVVGGLSSAAEAQWTFEEVTEVAVTLNNGGDGNYYATLCVPYAVTLTGAEAYTLTLNGNELETSDAMTEIPAGTPVLLIGTEATATLTVGNEYTTTPLTDNALTGNFLETTIDGSADYVLGKGDSGIGFYHWNQNTLAANRAYVTANTVGTDVKGLTLQFGDADAITGIEAERSEQGSIYNLAGQRVSKAVKGIYIVNGKKVAIK